MRIDKVKSFRGKNTIKYCAVLTAVSLLSTALCGCGDFSIIPDNSPVINDEDDSPSGPVVYGPGSYDSADTPILVKKDEEKGTLTFHNLDLGKNYTLEYDGTSRFYDKYGSTIALSQLNQGDIVDVRFVKDKKHLISMNVSTGAWVISETDKYSFDSVKREVTIGEDTYKISSDAVYFSDERQIKEEDIISTDRLTFHGIDNRVYSVSVDKGHGYLRLTGHQGFIDGWIEIGTSVIQRVTEDMLITVPEGKYQVKISGAGTTAEKNVVINRNSESSLDFSDVEFAKPKTGTVLFSINPTKAKLYVDGELTDVSEGIELTYGLHQLICKAEGYTTITQYLNVGQPSAGIDITLEEAENKDDTDTGSESDSTDTSSADTNNTDTNSSDTGNTDASSTDTNSSDTNGSDNSNSTENTDTSESNENNTNGGESDNTTDNTENSGNTNADVTTTYYKVYVDSPNGAEVYLDGSYVGIAPCSFKKTAGYHILTLSQTGYVTRSYTISVDSDDKDVSFSFADLVNEP